MVRDKSGSSNGLNRSATTAGSGVSSAARLSIPSQEQGAARAKMLYGHEASTPFEVSVPGMIFLYRRVLLLHLTDKSFRLDSESAVVSVITPDDGSGWIKVETQDRRQGLVPATYVEFVTLDSAENSPPPVIAPRFKRG